MTLGEAGDVFWRALEAGYFRDLEERLLYVERPLRGAGLDALRDRLATLLPDDVPPEWLDGVLSLRWSI